ncbi:hypothetical protein ABZV93_18630 [Actinopolymorpha sp. NPDC004070]|uniref:hypothetical protein n=1 Tax=Actinopolymorpha sp. NPDC004070 TaxID=3154548 RepID=UPI0033AC89F0
MKDVQKGRKSWLERLTSPPEDSEDNEQYDDQTQAFRPFPPDDGPRDGAPDDQRPEDQRGHERGGQDYAPEHGRRPEPGHDQERQGFGPGPHQPGSRLAGVEARQQDDFEAAFTPRGLRTPPSDFRTGPQDRVHAMGRPAQAPGPFRTDGGDAEAPERPGFRRTRPGSEGEPAWGGEPPQAPGGGPFGRHDAERHETERPETERHETERHETERPDAEQSEAGRADAGHSEAERPDVEHSGASRTDLDRPDDDRSGTEFGGERRGQAPAGRDHEAAGDEVTERPFTGGSESPESPEVPGSPVGPERNSRSGPNDDHDSAGAERVPDRDRQDAPDSPNALDRPNALGRPHRSDDPDSPAGPSTPGTVDSPGTSDVPVFPGASDVTDGTHAPDGSSEPDEAALRSGDRPGERVEADRPGDRVEADGDDAERRRRIDDLQQRWLDAQAKLLDDPRDAAHEAGLLVGEAMVFVTSTFTEHRDRIERDWREDADLGTDELLSIMRRYRSLFRSVLAASELPEDRR